MVEYLIKLCDHVHHGYANYYYQHRHSILSNSYIHWKLLVGWMILILLDSLANFRFEYLYPLIMFFRSIYDSYKYQGLVSVLPTPPLSLSFICKCTHIMHPAMYI